MIRKGLAYLRRLDADKVYVRALQTMVYVEAGQNEDRERIQRNVDWLIGARVVVGGELRGWSYTNAPTQQADNSNTQYAMLGLHAGHTAGARIDRAVWESIRHFYISTQKEDGGWIYDRRFGNVPTLTMTTAGLCGLLISGM